MRKDKGPYYLAAGIATATFAVYLRTLDSDFLNWDDPDYVVNNAHIRALGRDFWTWAFTSFYAGNWHPLTWISHALDAAVWGISPGGHHLTNSLLHALNTFLVVLLCVKLLEAAGRPQASPGGSGTIETRGAMIAAGVTGMLFGLHPVHVESVAWVSERKDLLCGTFFLLSLSAYADYARSWGSGTDDPGSLRFPRKPYLLSLCCFILALMSKPMAVSLPAVLLILDWYPYQRMSSWKSAKTAFLEKIPFVLCSLVSSILTVMAQRTTEAMQMTLFVPLWARVLVAAKAASSYLGKMVLPVSLSALYPYPDRSEVMHLLGQYLFWAGLLCAITALLFFTAARHRFLPAAWMFYLITLSPVAGFVQVGIQSMADRYTYLPSIGPFLVAGIAAARGFQAAGAPARRARGVQIVVVGGALFLCVLLAAATVKRIGVWSNDMALWNDVIEQYPTQCITAYNNRGLAFKDRGEFDRARSDFDTALSLDPKFYIAYRNRGSLWRDEGRYDRAIEDYTKAIALHQADYSVYGMRGSVYVMTGQPDRAIEDFTTLLKFSPADADALIGRAMILYEQGEIDGTIRDLTAAIDAAPSNYEAYNDRGLAFEYLHQYDRALADYDRSIGLNSAYYLSYHNRGVALGKLGRIEEAIEDQTRAISLNPDFPDSYIDRANLHLRAGSRELALRDFQKACSFGNRTGCDALHTYTK